MSTKLRLGCTAKRLSSPSPSSKPMIVRKPIELTVDEGSKVSLKNFIPTVINKDVKGIDFKNIYNIDD
jgi:hypothetical protein